MALLYSGVSDAQCRAICPVLLDSQHPVPVLQCHATLDHTPQHRDFRHQMPPTILPASSEQSIILKTNQLQPLKHALLGTALLLFIHE